MRSFADVAKGRTVPEPAFTVDLEGIKEVIEWSRDAVMVGEAKDFDTLCNFPSVFKLEGFVVVECKYLGGSV